MNLFSLLMSLSPLLFIALGYAVGRAREQSHFRSLAQREAAFGHMLITDLKTVSEPEDVEQSCLVMGEAVIATDYFKSFASQLRNLVGGRVKSLETLLVRARREAILRMLEQAERLGAREVHNLRIETSNVMARTGRAKAISAEIFAFGTAVVRKPGHDGPSGSLPINPPA